MTSDEVNRMLFVLLSQYNIKYSMQQIAKSFIFEVERFGVKIVYLDGKEFEDKILDGWHIAWIHPDFDTEKARHKIVWALIKGGYFHYLRNNYRNTFNRTISSEGWDKALIDERLRRYKNQPKYNYLKEINEEARAESPSFVLSIDPGFYDFIVE